MSARPSVYPQVSTRLPLYGISWNLILRTFTKISWAFQNLVNIGQKYWAFYMKKWVCHILGHDIKVCSARRETTHCCASLLRFQCLVHHWQQYMYVNNTNGTRCIYLVTVFRRTRHDFTLYAHCLSCYFYYLYSVLVHLQLCCCKHGWGKNRKQFGFIYFFYTSRNNFFSKVTDRYKLDLIDVVMVTLKSHSNKD